MPHDIRRVREDDLPSWLECLTTAFLDRPDVALMASQVVSHWDMNRVWGAFDGPVVGTTRTWATELTVPGGGQVPASAVSAVTVRPTHRRRGILRTMLATAHAAALEQGEPIAILHAAEAPIYGRFGYGPAVTACTWALDVRATGFVGPPATNIAFLPVAESTRDLMVRMHDQYRRGQIGEIRRRPVRFGMDLGLLENAWEPRWKGWLAVHRDDSGDADGYVRYSAESKWERGQPRSTITIQDLVALDDGAHDAIWRFLADIDLVATVTLERGSLDERLPWLLTNSRAAEPTGVGDALWVHILDIPRALASRSYERPGDVVLEIVDAESSPRPTRVHLEAGPEGATCAATKRDPDLTIHAGALGSAYLGGIPLRLSAIARGFEEHRPGALAEASALFRILEMPRCTTFF